MSTFYPVSFMEITASKEMHMIKLRTEFKILTSHWSVEITHNIIWKA